MTAVVPRPAIRLRPRPRVALASLLWALALPSACSAPPRCEAGICPVGMTCDPGSGSCVPDPNSAQTRLPSLRGHYALVPLPGLRHGIVGYAPAQKSLVWVEQGSDSQSTTFIAGPAAGDEAGPEGELSAATASASGDTHVAWLRTGDQTLWHAQRVDGKWQRTRVDAVPPKRAARRVAIAVMGNRPAIAFEDAIDGGVGVAVRGTDGVWALEKIPSPAPTVGAATALGGTLALSAAGGALTLATYDVQAGDLVLASRSADGWETARFAGRTGAPDAGDAGLPCALARDVGGALVVTWRDRSRNLVRVARSDGGAVTRKVVTDGTYAVAGRGIERRRVVGTSLAAVVRPNGRVAVAVQDASRARIFVAMEQADGSFKRYPVPDSGRPQLRPTLLARVDGALVVSWLDLEVDGAGAGRLATWVLSVTGESP